MIEHKDFTVIPTKPETKYFIPRIVEVSKEEYERYQSLESHHKKIRFVPWWESLANSLIGGW